MRAEKVPRLPTAGSTVINGKLTLTMDPLPGDLSRLIAQFVFLEIDCIRVKGGASGKGDCENQILQASVHDIFFPFSN